MDQIVDRIEQRLGLNDKAQAPGSTAAELFCGLGLEDTVWFRAGDIARNEEDEQSEKLNTGKLPPVTKNNANIKKLTAQPAASPKSLVVAPGKKKSTAPPDKPKINRWRAKQNGVNGRTGPGTQFDLAFKIDKSLTLELKRRDGKWGLFSYPAINGETGEIWIYLSLMKAY